MRTLAWWRRNGCRVQKGERAVLLSMFGNAFYGRNQVAGPDPGGIGPRETPPNALPDLGQPFAIAILAARAGVRLRAEWSQPEPFTDEQPRLLRPAAVKALPSLEVLEQALAAVRAYDETAVRCISCDGYGCVLCSCQEDRAPARSVSVQPKPATIRPVPKKSKIGRPLKDRPDRIRPVVAGLEDAARLRAEADRLEAAAKTAISAGIHQAQADGYSLRDIAASMGVSLTRVVQLRDAG